MVVGLLSHDAERTVQHLLQGHRSPAPVAAADLCPEKALVAPFLGQVGLEAGANPEIGSVGQPVFEEADAPEFRLPEPRNDLRLLGHSS